MADDKDKSNEPVAPLKDYIDKYNGDIIRAKIEWYKAKGITINEDLLDDWISTPEWEKRQEEWLEKHKDERVWRLHEVDGGMRSIKVTKQNTPDS